MAVRFSADANDFVCQWDASRDYNASLALERIRAPPLAVNAADDDERTPPRVRSHGARAEAGEERPPLPHPASEETRGDGNAGMAEFHKRRSRSS